MIISQARIEQLLQIFKEPKNIETIDFEHEKKEIKNASKFINDYHLYGPPSTYNQKTTQKIESPQLTETYANNEINENRQSVINIKRGHAEYIRDKKMKNLELQKTIRKAYTYYPTYNPTYDPTYESIASYEYQKNQKVLDSILGNPENETTYYSPDYIQYDNNYNSSTNHGLQISEINKLAKSSRLKDINPNQEDVIITEIPSNLVVSTNPLTCSNLGATYNPAINTVPNEINEVPQMLSRKPQIIEEINTDEIPMDISNQNQQKAQSITEENSQPEQEPVQAVGKYQITDFNGPVMLPPNYSTDDEDEFCAIQILNEDKSPYKLQIDKDNIKVYSKLYKIKNDEGKEVDNIMFYTEAIINYPAGEVSRQLNTYSLREQWEPSLKKGKLIKEEELPNNIRITDYYSYIKMPIIFSDRDLVIRKKLFMDYQGEKNCTLSRTKSIENPDFPPKSKPVRAEFENRAEYIKPINDNSCKLCIATKFDMKLNAPASMMEGKGSEGQAKWLKEFLKHCGN